MPPDWTPLLTKGPFLTDEVFSAAMASLPLYTVDIIAVNPGTEMFHLAKRKIHSAMGIWQFGGGVKSHETLRMAMVRLMKRETGLEFDRMDFSYICEVQGFWQFRQQEPQNAGQFCPNHVFGFVPTQDELVQMRGNLDPNEYDTEFGLSPYSRKELEGGVGAGEIRPIILYYHKLVFGS